MNGSRRTNNISNAIAAMMTSIIDRPDFGLIVKKHSVNFVGFLGIQFQLVNQRLQFDSGMRQNDFAMFNQVR